MVLSDLFGYVADADRFISKDDSTPLVVVVPVNIFFTRFILKKYISLPHVNPYYNYIIFYFLDFCKYVCRTWASTSSDKASKKLTVGSGYLKR